MNGARLSFERGGVRLSVRDFGGSGPPVLLLHGLAGHAGEWAQTAGWLSSEHRVLALDGRGHGHSEREPRDVSPEAHAADVAHVLDRLGLGPAVLIGQSLGANLALLVAASHPQRVRALIVAEGCPEADPHGEGATVVRRWLERWPVPFPSRESAVEFFGGPSLYAEAWAGGLAERDGGWWPRFDIEVMVRTLRAATSVERWSEWERIACPTLVAWGGQGYFESALIEEMVGRLAGSTSALISEAKHDLHLDRPAEWRALIEGFLGTLPAQRLETSSR